jgi:hypothetical protein
MIYLLIPLYLTTCVALWVVIHQRHVLPVSLKNWVLTILLIAFWPVHISVLGIVSYIEAINTGDKLPEVENGLGETPPDETP